MKQTEKVLEFLKGKESVKLEEFYANFENKPSVRGTINILVKKGIVLRISKSTYKLKE